MTKKRILITGIAGFIGSNLAKRLIREGLNVIGIDNLSYGLREQIPEGIEFAQVDIRSQEIYPLFKGVDYVFHLAAKNCIADCQKDPVETADINIKGTVNVFAAAHKYEVKKVVYAESSALYEGSKMLPTPESEVNPNSFYAISKLTSLYFAKAYTRYYNLKTTGLRYFCVYGPRQDYRRTIPPVFSAFIINLLKGKRPNIFGNGKKKRDFIYIDDINDFHIKCITDKRTTGKIFNLGSGTNYSINEIFSIIASMVQSRIKPKYKKDLPGEASTTLADITLAKSLGWVPKTSLKEGLIESINFIKEEINKGRI